MTRVEAEHVVIDEVARQRDDMIRASIQLDTTSFDLGAARAMCATLQTHLRIVYSEKQRLAYENQLLQREYVRADQRQSVYMGVIMVLVVLLGIAGVCIWSLV